MKFFVKFMYIFDSFWNIFDIVWYFFVTLLGFMNFFENLSFFYDLFLKIYAIFHTFLTFSKFFMTLFEELMITFDPPFWNLVCFNSSSYFGICLLFSSILDFHRNAYIVFGETFAIYKSSTIQQTFLFCILNIVKTSYFSKKKWPYK